MGVITAIEPQRNRKNRRSIFVDGEFVTGAHEDVVRLLGLAVGQSFGKSRLAELVRIETVGKAREKALRLISHRDRSVHEIKTKLLGSDFEPDIVEEVVQQLIRDGLLNDDKFSRQWVRSRQAGKPMGRARLSSELWAKGVDKPTIDQALEEIDEETEYRSAYELAARRITKIGSDQPTVRQRLIAFLGRRGFSWETIEKVMNRLADDRKCGEREED